MVRTSWRYPRGDVASALDLGQAAETVRGDTEIERRLARLQEEASAEDHDRGTGDESEYESYVRILYAPMLSADWPRWAMVRSIYQQITYLDPVVYDWAHIKSKTLVIGGELDGENFPALAKHIADTIPGAELVIIPNVGHVPHLQVPEIFNRELLKFLNQEQQN